MLELTTLATDPDTGEPTDALELPFERRQRSRLRVVLASGREAAVLLPRGTVLHDGDVLLGHGERVRVRAAAEDVSDVTAAEPTALARLAYHLGNRHVPLQVLDDGRLRYQHDHVLDAMVVGLGGTVRRGSLPFEPEPGAYAHGHTHEDPQIVKIRRA